MSQQWIEFDEGSPTRSAIIAGAYTVMLHDLAGKLGLGSFSDIFSQAVFAGSKSAILLKHEIDDEIDELLKRAARDFIDLDGKVSSGETLNRYIETYLAGRGVPGFERPSS